MFAREIVDVFRRRQKLIDDATQGSNIRKALTALKGVFDKETLVDVALRAKDSRVAFWILSEKTTPEVAIAVAKSHESRTVVEAALKKVSTNVLNEWNDGQDDWFSWAVEVELNSRK